MSAMMVTPRLHRVGIAVVVPVSRVSACQTCLWQSTNDRCNRRRIHNTSNKEQPASITAPIPQSRPETRRSTTRVSEERQPSGIAFLPLSQVLRSWFITSISSSPWLLRASTSLLQQMLNSKNPILSLERNPLMRFILHQTFYKQFCTGETPAEVARGCDQLRQQGYAGVILEYALEVLKDAEGDEEHDVAVWRKALLDTVNMAAPGDFVGLKWSGMGPAAMRLMAKNEEPTSRMQEAMHALCKAATAKEISLLPAAEETLTLEGFNNWVLSLQKVYNKGPRSVVYNTYQAYLKQTKDNLANHLEFAKQENFTLGVKLVRGAYLSSEERSKIWPNIEGTHQSYDSIASALIHRQSNDFLSPKAWPHINVVLATHNAATVQKAQALRMEQASRGEELTTLAFAQLQGMADEVSCSLIAAATASKNDPNAVQERVFKCTTWGPMYECLNYLLRRAAENRDAAGRTHETRNAMRAELWRRLKRVFALA